MATARHWSDALRWVVESEADPASAAANWLARDINPAFASAVAMLTSEAVTLAELEQAKEAFKTMRILGESAADRRMGARLYLAAIAAALVVHGARITRQSDRALDRALRAMVEDANAPAELRRLAGSALARLRNSQDDGF